MNPPAPPPAAKFWIIEHSTGIFVKWKKNFFFLKRPKFSWEGSYEEGFCFRNFEEAVRTLSAVRKTHPRAYLVEFKTRKSARML